MSADPLRAHLELAARALDPCLEVDVTIVSYTTPPAGHVLIAGRNWYPKRGGRARCRLTA